MKKVLKGIVCTVVASVYIWLAYIGGTAIGDILSDWFIGDD